MKNIEIIFNGNRNIGIDVSEDLWRRLQDTDEEVEFLIQVSPRKTEKNLETGVDIANTKIVTVTPVEAIAQKAEEEYLPNNNN